MDKEKIPDMPLSARGLLGMLGGISSGNEVSFLGGLEGNCKSEYDRA